MLGQVLQVKDQPGQTGGRDKELKLRSLGGHEREVGRRPICVESAVGQLPYPVSRTIGFVGHFRLLPFPTSLTPGSPPLVNSTPAASRAAIISSKFFFSGSRLPVSKFLIVLGLTPAASASSLCVISTRARAALHWAGVTH